MSKSFVRPAGGTRPITPGRLRSDSFTKGPDNHKPIDYNTPWKDYSAWRRRRSFQFQSPGFNYFRSNVHYSKKFLKNPAARKIQQGRIEPTYPVTGIDPENPFRPLEFWEEPIKEDEYLTQYNEKYEYPLIAKDFWQLKTKRIQRPTETFWRLPRERTWMERDLEHPHDPRPAHDPLTYCILREDVADLGVKGDVVAVDINQFREDLHPNRVAVVATRENCCLLGVPYDPLYQDHVRREKQGKLMFRQPWVWDQLQGVPWNEFTRPPENTDTSRDEPWSGEVERPIFAAELIAMRKEEAAAKKAIREEQEEKEKERKKGAAVAMFTL